MIVTKEILIGNKLWYWINNAIFIEKSHCLSDSPTESECKRTVHLKKYKCFLLISIFWICMCVWYVFRCAPVRINVWVQVCMQVHMHVCAGLRLILDVFFNCSVPYNEVGSVTLDPELTNLASLTHQLALGICFCLPHGGITGELPHLLGSFVNAGSQNSGSHHWANFQLWVMQILFLKEEKPK